MVLSEAQFERIRKLALSLAGLQLSERHRELLSRRSRRLGILNSARLEMLLKGAEAGGSDGFQQFLGLLTTKVTGFFRHAHHFDLAAEHAWRKVRRDGQAHLWSAAAATGEEPYSLGIKLIEISESDEPPVTILATDIDAEALRLAGRGEYQAAAVRDLDSTRRERFLSEGPSTGCWAVKPVLRRLVDFRILNLASVTWPIEGAFDVVFCRNVLMYMEPDHRYSVLEHVASLLQPDGLLFLDPTEGLGKASHLFTEGANGVFSLRRRRSCSVSLKASV